jgi:hypothetical protein
MLSINQLIELARKLYNRVPIQLRWIAAPLVYSYDILTDFAG